MRAVICLGNPGSEYERTRHNVGWLVADMLARRHNIDISRRRMRALYGRGRIAGEDVLIVKPQTFMNDSGDAARRVAQFYKITQNDLIAVYDEMALELGVVRVRRGGSDAGHKGIRSLIAHLGTQEIQRVRLGIGAPPPGADPRNWVLSDIKPGERQIVEEMVVRAAEAVECWIAEGIERAMNQYSR